MGEMDKQSWFRKHPILTGIFAIIILNIIFFSILPEKSEQNSLTGKVVDEGSSFEQTETPEENIQTDEQINNDEQNQEEECDWGYSGEYKCDGKVIRSEWVDSDCSSEWFYHFGCSYGCQDGECIYESEEVEEESDEENQEESYEIKVTYIVDGDTLDINTGERVRLVCIDTPERGEYYYSEAKNYLSSLVLNEEVELIKDVSEIDRYGRLLRYIYLNGDFINELIVKNGYARAYPYSPDTSLCPQIQEAEDYAKENNLGIWAEQEPEQTGNIICSYNAYNCADFSTHAEAQAVFEYCGSDVHRLDRDNDGSACETLP